MQKDIIIVKPAEKPYLTTGHRLYIIGSQDGLFPEKGEHMPYEMWGIWAPPIKLWNGFFFKVNEEWLLSASTYTQTPFCSKFTYEYQNKLKIERVQFVPQEIPGIVVAIRFQNILNEEQDYSLSMGLISNLMPVWLGERVGIENGKDFACYEKKSNAVFFRDNKNPWCGGMTSSEPIAEFIENAKCPVERRDNDTTLYSEVKVRVSLKEKEERLIYFLLGASMDGQEETLNILDDLRLNHDYLLQEKERKYKELSSTGALLYPKEPMLQEMYGWTQYINDWVIRDVPGIGKGVIAGYPEFPWWFGNDTNYIIPALLIQGEVEICKETLLMLKRKSLEINKNGRVVHEISSNGVVFYEGMTTETPQFADSVWQVYCYTGDYDFLKEMYEFCVEGMKWVESISQEGLPTGYGISEIAGLDCMCCDTAILAVRGFEVLGLMSEALGYQNAAKEYKEKFEKSWEQFQHEFYIPSLGVFGDMVATKEQIVERATTWQYTLKSFPLTEADMIMGESSCKKDKSPDDIKAKEKLRAQMKKILEIAESMPIGSRKSFYLFGLGHSAIPAEFGYIKGEQASLILEATEKNNLKKEIQFEKMMPIGLGRKIRAYGNAKEPRKILECIKEVAKGFSAVMPGATNEIYPEAGCFIQGWNSLVTMWPYANSIFGISPNAHKKQIILDPCICEEMDGITLQNIMIGNEPFTFSLLYRNNKKQITVESPNTEWNIEIVQKDIELIRKAR